MGTLLQDLRYGARVLFKSKGLTAVALLSLALGIGANTAIFSVVNAVLLRALPYPNSEQLLLLWGKLPQHGLDQLGASPPEFVDYREQNRAFSEIAAFGSTGVNLTGRGEPERVTGTYVSASLFPLLGVKPALGRTFFPEEDGDGHDLVVVLSHSLWQRRFAGDPGLIGQGVTLNGQTCTVIGVMPPGFQFPEPTTELWRPIAFSAEQLSEDERGSHWLGVIARLKSGVTLAQAQAEMDAIARRMQQEHPNHYEEGSGWGVTAIPLYEHLVGEARLGLLVLLGAVGFVLLIACANVANLLLARAAARQGEMAVRAALGASRWRLARQLLTESLVLALAGGGLGALLAMWGNDLLVRLGPANLPRLNEFSLDARVYGFTLVISLLTGVAFGLAPAWQASRLSLSEALKKGARGVAESRGRRRLRGLLVVGEVALALVLLIGAGLMIKSLYRLQQVEKGFSPAQVLTAMITLPRANYPEPQRQRAFFEQLLERVNTLPGVQAVGTVNFLPLSGTGNQRNFSMAGKPAPKLNVEFRQASPDYFRAIGIQLGAGRLFTERDRDGAPRVALINETLARLFYAGEDPLGQQIKLGTENGPFPWLTIVGVIRDVKHGGLDAETRPELYVPVLQPLLPDWQLQSQFLVMRAEADPAGLVADVRGVAQSLDPELPVYRVATMERLLARSLAPRRFNLLLLAVFAGVALALAAIGLFGVMSYAVTQRTHEIGIRMALGARVGDVVGMVIRQGMTLTLIGVVLGLAASFALTRWMASLLYDVSATDPATFALISLLLAGVALLACYLPARRASRMDPVMALRNE